ncbi:hypothetical protein LTR10_004660 [Elasticomyces elasticus]|nr:hypothetical protein LTR10_004660 [Elasticomyces elasticus]KAK4976979.1 hypothetical protein LTR42_003025 [Elasticomyces elasticus]
MDTKSSLTADAPRRLVHAMREQAQFQRDRCSHQLTFCSSFGQSKYSDLTIQCGERLWRVHKIIVCSQSPFFTKACDGSFTEAQQGTITLGENDPLVIAAMISYMYTCDYSDEVKADGMEDMMQILFNVHVHVLADKYDMPDLAEMAAKKFKEWAEKEWKDASFADAAGLVFTPDLPTAPLREVVVAIAVAHAGELNEDMVHLPFHKLQARYLHWVWLCGGSKARLPCTLVVSACASAHSSIAQQRCMST